jgi:hypothetical protein
MGDGDTPRLSYASELPQCATCIEAVFLPQRSCELRDLTTLRSTDSSEISVSAQSTAAIRGISSQSGTTSLFFNRSSAKPFETAASAIAGGRLHTEIVHGALDLLVISSSISAFIGLDK